MAAATAIASDRLLWSAQLRDATELRLTVKPYRGSQYVSLRNYWRTPGGEWVPTKKGCTFDAELVPGDYRGAGPGDDGQLAGVRRHTPAAHRA